MNIIKDENYYTVYNKYGVYVKCYQDKFEAQHVAQQISGRYTSTKHFVEKPIIDLQYNGFYSENEFLRKCGIYICNISLLLLPICLIALFIDLQHWIYYLIAVVFFVKTTILGNSLENRYTTKYE